MNADYLIIFPFASWEGRMWPIAKFIEIAKYILTKYPGVFVVFCGENNKLSQYISDEFYENKRVINLIGKTSLLELVNLTKNAKFVIANETSIIHIAAYLKVRSICLLGGGHFLRYLPYGESFDFLMEPTAVYNEMSCFGCNWKCTIAHNSDAVPCIDSINVEQVKYVVDVFLK